MPKKKKKDDAPLKKKQLLKLHVQELEESLRSATDERDGLAAKLAALEKEHKELATRYSSLGAERDRLRSETKQLDESVRARFQELAILARTLKDKEERLRQLNSFIGYGGTSAQAVEIHDSHEQQPHRHLNIQIEDLRATDMPNLQTLHLRLVEHYGRPGLAMFENARSSGNKLWSFWEETGSEAGRAYMLVVPSDRSGDRTLQAAKGQDFYLLKFLVQSIIGQLERLVRTEDGSSCDRGRFHPHKGILRSWLATAIALQADLASRDNQLRFNQAKHAHWRVASASAGQSTVTLENVSYGGLFMRSEKIGIELGESHSCMIFNDSPMFSALLPTAERRLHIHHQHSRFRGPDRISFEHRPSSLGLAYLAAIGKALTRIFLEPPTTEYEAGVSQSAIRLRVTRLAKALVALSMK
jgi:hypothetical protein